jgi:hypothetical protein
MVSLFMGEEEERDKLGQTQRQRQQQRKNQKTKKRELIVVVHKVGIIEAFGGAKLVSSKFLLGYIYPPLPPYHSLMCSNGK